MKILILHNAVRDDAPLDERDVLEQARAIEQSLVALGHSVSQFGCDHDLGVLERRFVWERPDLVFNLVESLLGSGRMLSVVPSLLDTLGIPFTGASTEALFVTTNKLLTKDRLRLAGLPTAPWRSSSRSRSPEAFQPGRYIVKSVWEHASIGLDDAAVAEYADEVALMAAVEGRRSKLGGTAFAERFIEGREINAGVLAGPDGITLLPLAEILFTDFPANKPKIVGYDSKWIEGSFEWDHTIRTFDLAGAGSAMTDRIAALTRQAWDLFDLSGYARVDFRIAEDGTPYILEVNANPCLSPDAGFAAGLEAAGIDYTEAIRRIVG